MQLQKVETETLTRILKTDNSLIFQSSVICPLSYTPANKDFLQAHLKKGIYILCHESSINRALDLIH